MWDSSRRPSLALHVSSLLGTLRLLLKSKISLGGCTMGGSQNIRLCKDGMNINPFSPVWKEEETIEHCLWFCPTAKSIWKNFSIWKTIKQGRSTIIDMLIHIKQQVSKEEFVFFLIMSWLLWNRRNKKRLNLHVLLNQSWTKWAQMEIDYMIHNISSPDRSKTPSPNKLSGWEAPPKESFCINCDASVLHTEAKIGLGVVVRTHSGEVIVTKPKPPLGIFTRVNVRLSSSNGNVVGRSVA
uniref:Reverse transcriptase zinc-binding domain-containing protein n=1 Tax=Cannabis sativa TaxID=3483 RepID=A0A803NG16_CANSA